MDDLPPPYSTHDPAVAASSPPQHQPPPLPITLTTTTTIASTSISPHISGYSSGISHTLPEPNSPNASIPTPDYDDGSFISGAPYFAIRPLNQPTPATAMQYRISIQPRSSPENVRFPGQEFVNRGINSLDWSTFLNHMFPMHGLSGSEQFNDYNEKPSATSRRSSSSDVKASPASRSGPASTSRRRTILAVVTEWNTHFFLPRGIRIVADLKTLHSTPTSMSSSSSSTLNIDAKPFGGETALYKAVNAADLPTVTLLLSKGANPNVKAFGYESTIYRVISAICNAAPDDTTAITTNTQILHLLLAHGADVNAKPALGSSPLHLAASKGNLGLVQLLLDHGANVNAKPTWAETALWSAAQRSDLPMLRLLLAHGADVNDSPAGYETALHGAVQRGDRPVIDLLLEASPQPFLGGKIWSGEVPVQLAAQRGDREVLKLLLDRGAKADESSAGAPTALGTAIANGDREMVEMLLAFGADAGRQSWGLESPLAAAVGKGDGELVALLLGAGSGAATQGREDVLRAQARKIALDKGELGIFKSLDGEDMS